MNHQTIVNALQTLCPGAHWTLSGDDLSGLIWLDDISTRPTDEAITAAIAAYVPPLTLVQQLATLQAQVATLLAAQGK